MNSTPVASTATAHEENAPRGRGRPHLLTPEIAREIGTIIRVYGLSDSHAGLLAGASSSSVSRWKQADEEFADLLERARAEFQRARIAALLDAARPDGTPDWRAQAWLLRNASAEGGWGKAAKPVQEAPSKTAEILPKNSQDAGGVDAERACQGKPEKRENLPKNTAISATGPERGEAVPAEREAADVRGAAAPATTDSARHGAGVVNKLNSVPKIVPLELDAAAPRNAGFAREGTEALSRVA